MFNPDVFALGVAVGVLGLVLLLSLVVSYAYDEPTLLLLAAYLVLMVVGLLVGQRLQLDAAGVPGLTLLVLSAVSRSRMRTARAWQHAQSPHG